MTPRPTEAGGRKALRDHVIDRALLARERYGDLRDHATFLRFLEDRELVRYPVAIEFAADVLEPGELAWPAPVGPRPADGFRMAVHPRFERRPDAVPLVVAYQLVAVNYGDIAGPEEAELFGATLLGLDAGAYYEALCRLADEPAGPPGRCRGPES
jgi:hypothetical protein